MRKRTDDAWFTNWRNAADQVGQITLACLPHAGAGASIYARWAALLPPWIDLVGITLPGRESRISESPLTSMDEVISRLGPAMSARVQEPFALFGHSLGALIGYELACWLGTRCGAARPELLVVSGRAAPVPGLRSRGRPGDRPAPSAQPCPAKRSRGTWTPRRRRVVGRAGVGSRRSRGGRPARPWSAP